MTLKRVGQRWTGLCPFHAEKSPSFSINAEEKLYLCFGCQASGDVITFVRETEHLDFAGAVERLARGGQHPAALRRQRGGRAGPQEARRAVQRDGKGRRVVPRPAAHRRRRPPGPRLSAASAATTATSLAQFSIGWAPDDWDQLARYLKLSDKELTDSGLGFVNRRGKQQDSFRGRIMFPIFDTAGKPVAFGGRILPGSDDPAEVQELVGDADLFEAPRALRAQLGQGRRRLVRRSRRVRGLHRRHRVLPRRRARARWPPAAPR